MTSYGYDGFWASMDTFKDKQVLEDMYVKGNVPWQVWKKDPAPKLAIAPATAVGGKISLRDVSAAMKPLSLVTRNSVLKIPMSRCPQRRH